MELNIDQMKELIELFEGSNLTEISVSQDNYQITLKKNSDGGVVAGRSDEVRQKLEEPTSATRSGEKERPETVSDEAAEAETAEGEVTVTSPIVGEFYRSPSPEDPPYVEVGDMVKEGDTVCIVEAMKVMNEVKAEDSGEVVEVCVEDGDPVEYGQDLFKLKPAGKGS